MKENCFVERGKRKEKRKVSKLAIQEYLSRVVEGIETNMPLIAKIADAERCSTVLERHVVQFFSYADSKVEKEGD